MERLGSRVCANPLSLCTEQGGPHSGEGARGHPKPEWRLIRYYYQKKILIIIYLQWRKKTLPLKLKITMNLLVVNMLKNQ